MTDIEVSVYDQTELFDVEKPERQHELPEPNIRQYLKRNHSGRGHGSLHWLLRHCSGERRGFFKFKERLSALQD